MFRNPSEKMKRRLQVLQDSLPAALARRFVETDLLAQAASLAFYALLSLAPLLVLLLWLTASLYPSAQQQLIEQIGQLAGSSAETVADTVIGNASRQPGVGSLAGLWSTVLLFIGATAVFARLQTALNLIFRTDGQRLDGLLAWLRKRVFSIGVVLALGFLLLVSMTLTTALQVIFARLPSLLPILGTMASLLVYVLTFAFLYHYLPDRRVRWRQAVLGGAITAVLFSGGRYLIGLYIAEAAPGSAYGSMGTLVILLVWIYYATLVFFIGALITAVIDERATERRRRRLGGDAAAAGERHAPAPAQARAPAA
jgi:membrane protein